MSILLFTFTVATRVGVAGPATLRVEIRSDMYSATKLYGHAHTSKFLMIGATFFQTELLYAWQQLAQH